MIHRKCRRKLRGIALLLSKFDYTEVKREFDGIIEQNDWNGIPLEDRALIIESADTRGGEELRWDISKIDLRKMKVYLAINMVSGSWGLTPRSESNRCFYR